MSVVFILHIGRHCRLCLCHPESGIYSILNQMWDDWQATVASFPVFVTRDLRLVDEIKKEQSRTYDGEHKRVGAT